MQTSSNHPDSTISSTERSHELEAVRPVVKHEKNLVVITDSSFKREALFGWDTINVLRKSGYAIEHYQLEELDSEQISSMSIPEHSTVLYAINEKSENLSGCVDLAKGRSLSQYNVIFDCWQENNIHFDSAADVSFLDLMREISGGFRDTGNVCRESIVLINPSGWQKGRAAI